MNSPSTSNISAAQYQKRFGCIAARIGASFNHVLTENITVGKFGEPGRLLKKGSAIFMEVQDTTRHPELAAQAKWVCRHPDCKGSAHASKAELLKSHINHKDLVKNEQTHCYYAVALIPGVEARAEKLGKDGTIVEEAVPFSRPSVMILSDEE